MVSTVQAKCHHRIGPFKYLLPVCPKYFKIGFIFLIAKVKCLFGFNRFVSWVFLVLNIKTIINITPFGLFVTLGGYADTHTAINVLRGT